MSGTTGPILVAGAVTWANQTILADDVNGDELFDKTVSMAVTTGLLAGVMYGLEQFNVSIARAFSYAILATALLVRVNNKPTPLERALDLAT